MSKVTQTLTCWIWEGAKLKTGYGSFWNGRKNVRAHRYAFELFSGRPSKSNVLHSCDNRLCVSPAHLFEGTQQDNIADCRSKGRHWLQTNPEKHARKLTESQIDRADYLHDAEGRSWRSLGKHLGVHPTTIMRACLKGRNGR